MRFVLESPHRDFFSKHGYISFADLFTDEILSQAEHAISKTSRDLWRTQPAIEAIVLQKKCAKIAAELTHSTTIRIAYDQSLCGSANFPTSPFSFEDASCIQPILCVVILRLTSGPTIEMAMPYCPCPQERGEALFLSGKTLIVLNPLLALPKQKFLLIAYSNGRPQYVPKEKDPFVNSLKPLGYAFGDHLNTSTHPTLFSQN